MKKLISLLLTTFAVFAFMGCADDSKSSGYQTVGALEGVKIEPKPENNVITLTENDFGQYSITFTNATLSSGNPNDVFFQFQLIDDNNITDFRFSNDRCNINKEKKIVYGDFNVGLGSHCTVTYTISGPTKKDIKMDKFIATLNDGNIVEPDLNNTKGDTITIKHQ